MRGVRGCEERSWQAVDLGTAPSGTVPGTRRATSLDDSTGVGPGWARSNQPLDAARPCSYRAGQVPPPLTLREVLDRISQRGPRQHLVVLSQECLLHGSITLADLAQQPADRLVNEIVAVVQQQRGDAKRRSELTLLDPVERREHRDSPLPEIGRSRESFEHLELVRNDMRADNVLGGRIDQIPVVDASRVRKIRIVHGLLVGTLAALVDAHQEDQPEEPLLVPPGLQ